MPHARRLVFALLLPLVLAAGVAVPGRAAAQMTDPAETLPRIRAIQRKAFLQKMQSRMATAAAYQHREETAADDAFEAFAGNRLMRSSRAAVRADLEAARAKPPLEPGTGRRLSRDEREAGYVAPTAADIYRRRAEAAAAQGVVPFPNVMANNRSGDGASAGQCEEDIAALGNNILVAWNDGQGFNDGTNDTQGWGYSTDGGATFTDGGKLPHPAGMLTFVWTSDPIVTVNEKTGEFWYAGLCSPTSTSNGIAVVKGTFSGSNFTWGTPVIVRQESSFQFFLDKPWMVADSLSGNLYLTYTEFNTSADEIDFKRSTDGGASWSSDIKINSAADDGAVQGSRPAVGPNGEVHVVYYTIGTGDSDIMNYRMSSNGGVSFGAISQAGVFHPNFGTGAPGFNREMGIQFPSIAVDRSNGPNRGRVYVAWNETVNWLTQSLSTGTGAVDTEPNDTPAQATPMTIGQPVRGTCGSNTGDLDYFSFSATQGQTLIFWADSLAGNLTYTLRVFCTDQTTRLAFSGDLTSGGGNGFIVWTAPATATYYMRVASVTLGGASSYPTGPYRVLTKLYPGGPERGRDTRDVFVSSSATNGLSWTTPTRVNDDPGWFDDWLPEIEVGGNGIPYVIWYDWRDATAHCGGRSHVYLARSDDAGGSWVSLGPVTDVESDWTNGFSNIAPNQGDYLGLYANDTNLFNAWADDRNGDPDVYVSVWPLAATPVQISLATVSAAPDRVDLSWFAGGDPLDQATVERRTGTGDWQALATIYVDGDHRLSYTDTDVTAGSRYGYRLHIVDAGTDRYVGETWVDVPARSSLAIANIRPNPSRRDAYLSFSLPNGDPATLTVLDIAGRVIRQQEVGSLGGGAHQIVLQRSGDLGPGLYLVRLTQGNRSVTTRWTVVQ